MVGSRLLARGRGPAIPLATTADLAAPVRRTLVLRIGIAVALVVLALAASETGRSNAAAARGLLPGGGSGVLVLDVSRSIKPSANRTIVNVLQQLINSQSRVGLVAFSDIAYELFPPGTPSRELRPLLRFFAPLPGWPCRTMLGPSLCSTVFLPEPAHFPPSGDAAPPACLLLPGRVFAPMARRRRPGPLPLRPRDL